MKATKQQQKHGLSIYFLEVLQFLFIKKEEIIVYDNKHNFIWLVLMCHLNMALSHFRYTQGTKSS